MRCTNCGCDNPSYAVVCEQCGDFLPKEDLTGVRKNADDVPEAAPEFDDSILDPVGGKQIRCSYCWYINDAEEEFCEICGMPLGYVPYPEKEGEFSEIPLPETEDGSSENPGSEDGEEAGQNDNESPVAPRVNYRSYHLNLIAPGRIRCRGCFRENPVTAVHCEFCGRKLRQGKGSGTNDAEGFDPLKKLRDSKITCVECGYSAPWSAITCPTCGANPRTGKPFWSILLDDPEDDDSNSAARKKERYAIQHIQRDSESTPPPRSTSLSGKNPGASSNTIRCTKCWEYSWASAEHCQWCGAPLIVHGVKGRGSGRNARKMCTCGYKNLPKVTVCLKCGGSIYPDEVVLPNQRKVCTCGYKNLPGVSVCLKCKQYVLKKCSHCGFEQPANVTVCARCKHHVD